MFEDAKNSTEKTKKVPTRFAIEARKMDQARRGDYWSEPHEMAARAFAAYVEDKVAESGGQSDFLVYHAHGGILLPMIDGFVARPYPEGDERVTLKKAFDNFVGEVKTKPTDKGVALYSQTPNPTGSTVAIGKQEIAGQYNQARVKIVQSVDELPDGAKFMTAWHGSPHDFDRFSSEYNRTGEGANSFGEGHYFAGAKEVAEWYRDSLSKSRKLQYNGVAIDNAYLSVMRRVDGRYNDDPSYRVFEDLLDYGSIEEVEKTYSNLDMIPDGGFKDRYVKAAEWLSKNKDRISMTPGRLYQVELAPAEDEYLLWDRPLSEQSDKVRAALNNSNLDFDRIYRQRGGSNGEPHGKAVYQQLANTTHGWDGGIADGTERGASSYLLANGIRGIKYLDGSSRGKGDGNFNYVIFNDQDVTITAKYQKNKAQIQGAFHNDTIYLVADHIAKGEWSSVLHHEGFHRGMASGQFNDLLSELERMEKRYTGNGAMAKWFEEARAKAQVDRGKPHYIEEIGAYAVSTYTESPNVIKAWVDRLIAKVKLALRQVGVKVNLTPAMLREVAVRGLMAGRVEGVEGTAKASKDIPFKPVDPNSPNLKKFLGDSQITTPVFHGSPEMFWTFDKNKLGKNSASPGTGLGFFFAMDRLEAQRYAGVGGDNRSFYVKVEKPKRMQAHQLPKFRDAEEAQAYAKRQQLSGFDSIILEDEGHVIVFEPNQVKSAEVNTGAFSPDNADTRYSKQNPTFKPVDVNSASFRKWFGDSKVVDEEGKPLVVYHGTVASSPIDQFSGDAYAGWFAESHEKANQYASDVYGDAENGAIYPVHLAIKNPLDLYSSFDSDFKFVAENIANVMGVPRDEVQELFDDYSWSSTYAGLIHTRDFQEWTESLGYDGIIAKEGGEKTYAAFSPTQIKSAISNTGDFSPTTPNIRYSVRQAEEEVRQEIGTISEMVNDKVDLKPGERIIATAEYTLVKDPAGKRMVEAAERRQTRKFEMENHILDGTLPSEAWNDDNDGSYSNHFQETHNTYVNTWEGLNATDRAQAQQDLLDADASGKWFRLHNINGYEVKAPNGDVVGMAKTKEEAYEKIKTHHVANYGKNSGVFMSEYTGLDEKKDRWLIINPKGATIGNYATEKMAIRRMMDAEADHLRNQGRNEEVLYAIRLFREMTNRAFDLQVSDLRRIMEEREDLGLPPLTVDIPDESKRYAIKDKSGKVVTTYATEEEARIQLYELAKYKAGFSGVNVTRQSDLEIMQPAGLQEYIAMIGDLRGSYFPRQRQSGGVQMTAINNKTGERYLENFDLYITKGKKLDTVTGEEVSESKLMKLARSALNYGTPLGRRMRELQRQGFNVTIKKSAQMPEDVFAAAQLASSITAMLDEGMSRVEGKPSEAFQNAYAEIHKSVVATMADIFKQRGALSSRIKRADEYWKGFETDPLKAGVQYAKGMAGGIAKRFAAQEITMAMTGRDISWKQFKEMEGNEDTTWEDYQEFVSKRKIDPKTQPEMYKEAISWTKEVLRNDEQLDRIVGTLRGLATLKYLGFRVASAAVNLTNLVQAVPATISSQSKGTITGALNQVVRSLGARRSYLKGSANELDKRIFTEISEKGWDSAQFNYEAAAVLRSKAGNRFAKFSDAAMWMFGKAEQINRAATIHAAYMEMKKAFPALKHSELMEKAKHASDRAHGVYGKETAPVWTRGSGNPLRMTYTFMKFSQNYMLNMVEMVGKGDYKNASYMLLSPSILGGMGASLATPVIMALAKAFGIGGDDPEEELYKWAEQQFGNDAILRHGLPGLVGISFKGSLTVNNPVPTTIEEIFGAPGSLFFDMRDAYRETKKGAYGKAAEKMLPTGLVAPFKAYREYDEGVTTGSYSRVYYGDEPLKGDGWDAALRAFSFNPSKLAGIREKQYNERTVAAKYQTMKKDIYAQFKKAWLAGNGRIDRGDWLELMGDVERYNDRVKGLARPDVQPITKKDIRTMLKRNAKAPKRERERDVA